MRKIILLLLFSASQIFCQNYIWEKFPTPTDGQLLTHHFSNDGSIYISIYGHGLLKSKDNGLTWAKVNNGLGNQLNIISIVEKSDGILFALGDSYPNKLYQSTDKGSSWEIIAEFVSGSDRFTQVAVSDSAVYLVYQGYGGAICRAKFSDKKWKYVFTNNSYLERMFITSKGTIYTIDGDGKLFKSNDGGDSFTQNQSKMPYAENSNGYLFSYSNSEGIYRSLDDGSSWQKVNTGLPDEIINRPNIAIDKDDNLYSIKHKLISNVEEYTDEVYVSKDDGLNWAKSFSIPYSNIISRDGVGISFSNSNEMFLSNSFGLNRFNKINLSLSTISSTNLIEMNRSITTLFIKDGILYASGTCPTQNSSVLGGNKVYLYNGSSWETKNCLSPNQLVTKIGYIPNNGVLFGFSDEANDVYQMGGGVNFVGSFDLSIYMLNYTSSKYFAGYSVKSFANLGDTLFYGTSKGVFKMDNNYPKELNNGLTNKDVLSMATNNSFLFCGTNGGGVYRYQKSPISGWEWKQINNGLTEYWISSLVTTSNGYIFTGADNGGGVFYSTDNGDTWKRSNANTIFKSGSISSMIVAKDRIFAIRNLSDVYLSTDFAQTWQKITDTLSNNYPINALAYDEQTDYLYIGTSHYGIKRVLINTQTSVTDNNANIPTEFILEQNYPNPFNPSTTISFSLPKSSYVFLKLYNNLGQEMETITNGYFYAGKHSVQFNAKNLSSGVYFYKLTADNFSTTKKLMIIK